MLAELDGLPRIEGLDERPAPSLEGSGLAVIVEGLAIAAIGIALYRLWERSKAKP